MTIVYKSSIDLFLYVVGSSYENEVNSGGWGDKEGLSVGELETAQNDSSRTCLSSPRQEPRRSAGWG